jgi:hypothetical protein
MIVCFDIGVSQFVENVHVCLYGIITVTVECIPNVQGEWMSRIKMSLRLWFV